VWWNGVTAPSLLALVLCGGEWSFSCSSQFTSGERTLDTSWTGGRVSLPRVSLDAVEQRKILAPAGNQTPVLQLISDRCTDWGIFKMLLVLELSKKLISILWIQKGLALLLYVHIRLKFTLHDLTHRRMGCPGTFNRFASDSENCLKQWPKLSPEDLCRHAREIPWDLSNKPCGREFN
jgi:hypothetical protein